METTKKTKRQILEGEVVSDKMNKTVVVNVTRLTPHPKYGKIIKKAKKFMAHDEKEICKVGDFVQIVNCRPISKNKKWRVFSIVKKRKEIEDLNIINENADLYSQGNKI